MLAGGYAQPKSFTHAVKIFKQIDMEYKRTAFSDKAYDYDPATCMRKLYLVEDPRQEVVFTRIVPENLIAQDLACYKEDLCTGMLGESYHGKRCCRKIDKTYKAYERDMFNLMSLEKGSRYPSVQPPLHYRGNIARVFLYMTQAYKLKLSKNQYEKYEKWDKEDKVDEKECKLYQTIYKIQGRENPWIKSSCEILTSKSSKSSQE